jgi:hypothetical protein
MSEDLIGIDKLQQLITARTVQPVAQLHDGESGRGWHRDQGRVA